MKNILLVVLLGLSFAAVADDAAISNDVGPAVAVDAQSGAQDGPMPGSDPNANNEQPPASTTQSDAQTTPPEKLTIKLDCGDCKVADEIVVLLKSEYAGKAKSDAAPVVFTIKQYNARPTAARIAFGTLSGKDEISGVAQYNDKTAVVGDTARTGFCGTECVAKNVSEALAKLQN